MKIEVLSSPPVASPPYSAQPIQLVSVACGFPSPAEDFTDRKLDLNERLVSHPSSTYFVRASGESLAGRGIHNGDLLVVDRSLEAVNGSIVISSINAELCCKILDLKNKQFVSDNPDFPPIPIPVINYVPPSSVLLHVADSSDKICFDFFERFVNDTDKEKGEAITKTIARWRAQRTARQSSFVDSLT